MFVSVRPRECTVDNVLLLSLDEGLSRRIQPGGMERLDVLGAAGRRGAVDKNEKVHDDRPDRLVSASASFCSCRDNSIPYFPKRTGDGIKCAYRLFCVLVRCEADFACLD